MKHDITFTPNDSQTFSSDFGVSEDQFHLAVSNLLMETMHSMLFQDDHRSAPEAYMSCIDTMTPEEFGFDVATPNGKVMLGFCMMAAHDRFKRIARTLGGDREDRMESVMEKIMEIHKEADTKDMLHKVSGSKN